MSISKDELRRMQLDSEQAATKVAGEGSLFSAWQDARDRALIWHALEHERANNAVKGTFVVAMHNEYIRGVNDERRRILRRLGIDIANPIAKTGD